MSNDSGDIYFCLCPGVLEGETRGQLPYGCKLALVTMTLLNTAARPEGRVTPCKLPLNVSGRLMNLPCSCICCSQNYEFSGWRGNQTVLPYCFPQANSALGTGRQGGELAQGSHTAASVPLSLGGLGHLPDRPKHQGVSGAMTSGPPPKHARFGT